MWNDVVDLRDFYASSLGAVARRMIRRQLRTVWPDVKGQKVLGIGYPPPYLSTLRQDATQVVAVMPSRQGVLHWPQDEPSLTLLADETELPFPDITFDKVLIIHTLENSARYRRLMREAWRVLSGSGKLLVIVPNRRGIWARTEQTPFGIGLPYSRGQLSRLLRDTMFTPIGSHGALFLPPLKSRLWLSAAPAVENVGQRFFSAFAGVIMVEATKQIYAGTPVTERKRRFVPATAGFPGGTGSSRTLHRKLSNKKS